MTATKGYRALTGYAFSHAEGYTAEAAADALLRDDAAPEQEPPDMSTAALACRIATQRAEHLHRLANHADRAGVRILIEPVRGEHFATDPSTPTRLYRVDPEACTCRRFRLWGRCPHHALLLAELGRIPDPFPWSHRRHPARWKRSTSDPVSRTRDCRVAPWSQRPNRPGPVGSPLPTGALSAEPAIDREEEPTP